MRGWMCTGIVGSLLLVWSATVPRAAGAPALGSPEMASSRPPGSYPNGFVLLQRSLTVARHKIHTVRGDEATTATETAQHKTSILRLDGACALTGSSIAVHVSQRLSGSMFGTQPTGGEVIVIASQHTSAAWSRSMRPHARWLPADFAQLGGSILNVCPSMVIRQAAALNARDFVTRGSITVDGRPAWYVRGTYRPAGAPKNGASTVDLDLYLDQKTMFMRRIVETGAGSGSTVRSVIRYSAFNAPVHIVPPIRGGSAGPPAPSAGRNPGVFATVTPNPVPLNAYPTFSVVTEAGSRCTPRVVYQSSEPRSHSSAGHGLGMKRTGKSGLARWTWHETSGAFGGAVIVDCVRGSGRTNQVVSFTIFP